MPGAWPSRGKRPQGRPGTKDWSMRMEVVRGRSWALSHFLSQLEQTKTGPMAAGSMPRSGWTMMPVTGRQ